MYLHTTARKRCLKEAKEKRNVHLFTRKKQILAPPPQQRHRANNRHHSELSLRRTPSPHRRVSTVESPNLSGKKNAQAPSSANPVHKLSQEEGVDYTPLRTGTGSSFGSMHSPSIYEGHVTSTPINTPEAGSQPQSAGFSGQAGFRFTTGEGTPMPHPLRSASASSAESNTSRRSPVLRRPRHSRVLVVPSVATVTFVPRSPKINNGFFKEQSSDQEQGAKPSSDK